MLWDDVLHILTHPSRTNSVMNWFLLSMFLRREQCYANPPRWHLMVFQLSSYISVAFSVIFNSFRTSHIDCNSMTHVTLENRRASRSVLEKLDHEPSTNTTSSVKCLQKHKDGTTSKLSDCTQLGVYLAGQNILFKIHLWKHNREVKTNYVMFDTDWYPNQQ